MKQLINRLTCLFKGHIYYDCICGRCGKHLFDAPMKRFFKRIICLYIGHEWELKGVSDLLTKSKELTLKCARCGKIKEEVI